MIVISRYGLAKDYDREFFISLTTLDETASLYYDDYVTRLGISEEDQENEEFIQFMKKFAINGYLHCNQPGLTARNGERVRWYLITLGTEVDIHSATWTGQTVSQYRTRKTALVLQPASMHTVDMLITGCGDFSFYCGVHEHLEHGMASNFIVTREKGGVCPKQGKNYNKQAFIQAEEYEWDYASSGQGCQGEFTEHEDIFLKNGDDRIGRRYIKARYRGYTDSTFRTTSNAPAYLGILGPTFRVAVGDTIRVVFRNNLSFPVNIVPLGLFYSSDKVAQPGETVVYYWTAPSSSGPDSNDANTVPWLYRSTYNEVYTQQAGLAGAVIVGPPGSNGFARDVQREYVLGVSIVNENVSPFLNRNIRAYTQVTEGNETDALIADPDFEESNLKHSFNGYLFCNLQLKAVRGERVRFYLLSVGSSLDMHSVTVRDNTQLSGKLSVSTRTFASDIYAGSSRSVDVFVDRVGTFLVQCDVHDHHDAGMIATLRVKNN